MHPLLRQQLQAHLGVTAEELPAELAAFVHAVDAAYRHDDGTAQQIDGTQFTEAQPATHLANARLRSVLSALPDGVVTLERDGRIVDVHADNGSMPERKVLGRNIRGLLDDSEARKALEEVRTCLSERTVRQFEVRRSHADGMGYFEVRLAPHDDDSVIAVVRDVTADRDRRGESLQAEHAAWLRLAHNLAHDINNPLTTVITNLVLMHEDTTSPHTNKVVELVSEAIIGAHRVRDVVANLRAAAPSSLGAAMPSPDYVTHSEPTAQITSFNPDKAHFARVLIIDDEPMVARGIARALRSCETVIQNHAEDAVKHILDCGPYDVMICDLMMPGMTGMELYDTVVAQRPELASRFVFISGGTVDRTPSSFFARVSNTHLQKPFDPSALRHAVAEVMHG